VRPYLLLLTAFFYCLHVQAQDETEWKDASAASKVYHEYRIKLSTPPYGLAKVKQLLQHVQTSERDEEKLSQKDYNGLSLREKFTYHMIHAEINSQNCDASPPIQDEDKKIFGRLPDAFDDWSWSERQVRFLSNNRDSVMALIMESTNRSKRMGLNYKEALVEINAREMIPYLRQAYKDNPKDHDILTVLMLLLKNNEYAPFMNSASFRKLYGDQADYRASIAFNKANEALILQRALDYYESIPR
jgi:hypothetical protein